MWTFIDVLKNLCIMRAVILTRVTSNPVYWISFLAWPSPYRFPTSARASSLCIFARCREPHEPPRPAGAHEAVCTLKASFTSISPQPEGATECAFTRILFCILLDWTNNYRLAIVLQLCLFLYSQDGELLPYFVAIVDEKFNFLLIYIIVRLSQCVAILVQTYCL